MIDFFLVSYASQNGWEGFLRDLSRGGLDGKGCETVATAGERGFMQALEVVYPHLPRQPAGANMSRNVLNKVRRIDQKEVKRDLDPIAYAKSRKLVIQAHWAFYHKYRKLYPGAVKSLEAAIEDLLCFYEIKLSPEERKGRDVQELQRAQEALWQKLRTTNLIEESLPGR
jgi:transposase-like protein